MSILVWAGQHRLWLVGIGVLLVAAAAAAGVWYFVLRSPGTQVDLRQALRLYRHEERGKEGDGSPRLPKSGVYVYGTTGSENLSFAGIARRFPSPSEIIVTDGGGCSTMKWVPLEQHTESLKMCPTADGGYRIATMTSYEKIAGVGTTTVIHCPAGTYLVPPDPKAGRTWHSTCHEAGNQPVPVSGSVVGPATVTVGGTGVHALHTRLDLHFTGAESGSNPNDYWVSDTDGLVLRQHESVDLSQGTGPLGSVQYRESMAIALRSTEPAR